MKLDFRRTFKFLGQKWHVLDSIPLNEYAFRNLSQCFQTKNDFIYAQITEWFIFGLINLKPLFQSQIINGIL